MSHNTAAAGSATTPSGSAGPLKRATRVAGASALVVAALGLSGCGDSAVVTCDEFAHLSPDTGLFSTMNSAQTSALQNSLKEAGYDDSGYNVAIGWGEVISYCNIYDGVAGSNASSPISNAH